MTVSDAITYCIHYHKFNSRPNTLSNYEFLLGKFGPTYQGRCIDSIPVTEIISFLEKITEGRKEEAASGRFRSDLYYRLNVFLWQY